VPVLDAVYTHACALPAPLLSELGPTVVVPSSTGSSVGFAEVAADASPILVGWTSWWDAPHVTPKPPITATRAITAAISRNYG
jgi:hypothetical protein